MQAAERRWAHGGGEVAHVLQRYEMVHEYVVVQRNLHGHGDNHGVLQGCR